MGRQTGSFRNFWKGTKHGKSRLVKRLKTQPTREPELVDPKAWLGLVENMLGDLL